jgi:hypothetical protein
LEVARLSEDKHQENVIKWKMQPHIMARWPEVALLFHIPNERKCTPEQGARLKRMGVRSGVPDLCLPVARGRYHGLYIEMKTPDGHTTREQNWWGEHLIAQGYMWEVCHGWESAVAVLEWSLQL